VSEAVEFALRTLWIGVGATVLMDLGSVLRRRLFGIASLDYAFVGRWLVHLTRGRFFHDPIAKSPRVSGERVIGWTAHYLIGIAFCVMQPAMGAGFAARRTPRPAMARFQSLVTHGIFGVGLYLAARFAGVIGV